MMNRRMIRRQGRRENERGSVLAVSALGMLSLLLAVGLGVDISHFYVVKTELKNAADAAALAGVSALNSSPGGITEATTRAVAAMNSYEFNNKGVVINRSNVQFSATLDGTYMSEAAAATTAVAPTIRFVKVTVPPKEVNVLFATPVLGGKQSLSAEATAGLSVPLNVVFSFIPLAVTDNNLTPGQTYTIRASPQNQVSPGNYQVLAVDGRGASTAREGIARGVFNAARVGDVYAVDTEPGVNSGPTRQGINTRFDEYTSGMDPSQYPPDTNVMENITYEQYKSGDPQFKQAPTHPGVAGRRVVIIPIVEETQFNQGRDEVTFKKFGVFFLRSKVSNGNGGDIQAEYIGNPTVIGAGGFDPTAGPGDPLLTMPVLYR
jgi:Flp pilus assembly protein TadG